MCSPASLIEMMHSNKALSTRVSVCFCFLIVFMRDKRQIKNNCLEQLQDAAQMLTVSNAHAVMGKSKNARLGKTQKIQANKFEEHGGVNKQKRCLIQCPLIIIPTLLH